MWRYFYYGLSHILIRILNISNYTPLNGRYSNETFSRARFDYCQFISKSNLLYQIDKTSYMKMRLNIYIFLHFDTLFPTQWNVDLNSARYQLFEIFYWDLRAFMLFTKKKRFLVYPVLLWMQSKYIKWKPDSRKDLFLLPFRKVITFLLLAPFCFAFVSGTFLHFFFPLRKKVIRSKLYMAFENIVIN